MRRVDSSKVDSNIGAVARVLVITLIAAILSACGGTDSGTTAIPQAAVAESLSVTLSAPAVAAGVVLPTFHLAPVILDEPDDTDRSEPMSSAHVTPHRVAVAPAFAQLSTRRLTPRVLEQVRDTGMAPEGTALAPMASTGSVTTYTPAQIRAAYGLPALPSTSTSVTSAQAAQLGAGQTIYLIDAQSDPNIAAELASFDSKFGLPGCTVTSIATSASLPLAPPPTTGCTFSIVYSSPSGTMAASAPAYDSGWATEIALDVQWAHATAPYARIILIEAADSGNSLFMAVQLANQMGPGVVSQSFGGAEGSWELALDSTYSGTNMTYLASTGDAGAAVNYPAASARVLAVSGTSLSYSGTGPRTETVWSDTGGGMVSAFVATPAYQTLAVPGLADPAHRAVADVAFNADPDTGQFLAIITPGATSVTWYSGGGTSLASPQWAGIVAVANALRAQSAVAPIGASQPTLYGLAAQASSYASAFLDVTKGSDGTCTTCYTGVGYDMPTGLGTPNVQNLWAALGTKVAVAPVVTNATVSGKAAVALSFAITATAADPLTYSLTGAPSGMSVNASTGLITWSAPVAGSYSVIAHALDAHTGLSGQGTLSVSIIAPQPPRVAGGSVAGTAQTALTFAAQVTDPNVVTYSLSGAPSGMSVSSAGVVGWPSPLVGTYTVTVIALDASTGLSGRGIYTVTITAAKPPTVASASLAFPVGKALSFCVTATATDPLTYSLTGAPAGMTVASTGCVTWATPKLGAFTVTVTAQDTKTGLTGKGVETLSIIPSGPVISATPLTGVAGKAVTGSITFTDSTSFSFSVRVSGLPVGMSFSPSGNKLNVSWASPVTGRYSLQVTATDSQQLTASATIPVTITAH